MPVKLHRLVILVASLIVMAINSQSVFAKEQTWNFTVYLGDEEIGQHYFRVSDVDGRIHVETEAEFNVKFLFLTVYKYRHKNYEVWNGECLESIASETNDNGDKLFVHGEAAGQQFTVETAEGKQALNGCIKSFAYWGLDKLNSDALLNSQTGELLEVDFYPVTADSNSLANDGKQQYRIEAKDMLIDLWYGLDNQWLALNSTLESGRVLRYEMK